MRTLLALCVVLAISSHRPPACEDEGGDEPRLVFPCNGYLEALRGRGNFGRLVESRTSPFAGTYHLGEDVWVRGGVEVRAIAAGIVRYSAFSPTWTDDRGRVHWNLGNVSVIEHELAPPDGDLATFCSFYVHLAADRRVEVGARVERGEAIGRVGKGNSEENGRYPAHLHFGIHRGPYVQIPPALERELREAASSKDGLRFGEILLRGELAIELYDEDSVLIAAKSDGKKAILSLLVGSTAPKDPPPDIMGWCQGYGDRETVAEWIAPSTLLRRHAPR